MKRTSFFYFALNDIYLLFLDGGSVWIETAQFLRFFPCEHAVCSLLIFCFWHYVFVYRGHIGKVLLHVRWAGINDLEDHDWASVSLVSMPNKCK
jgi:hypothetical protein